MSHLRDYLAEAPALVWSWVFRSNEFLSSSAWGFDVEASLPTARHFGRVLRTCFAQRGAAISCSTAPFPCCVGITPDVRFGQAISLDTAHFGLGEENNPKAYVLEGDRLDKTRQPKGDRDCKLGCKEAQCLLRGSQSRNHSGSTGTPTKRPKP
ncbi:MAG: hypothetical protein HS114_19265 [Anaerolineales bacterium]|nr:hypothetical protein [Anaerolineales bacterium]